MNDKYKGKDLMVYVGTVPIGCDKTCTIAGTMKSVDTTSKCSVDIYGSMQEESIPISTLIKITGNGFTVYDTVASGSPSEYSSGLLWQAFIHQQILTASYKSANDNGAFRFYTGPVFISSLKESADAQGVLTYDYELTQSGNWYFPQSHS